MRQHSPVLCVGREATEVRGQDKVLRSTEHYSNAMQSNAKQSNAKHSFEARRVEERAHKVRSSEMLGQR